MSQPASVIAPLDPRLFPRIGTVDDRFQSYNVEMVEVIGGRFWKPYAGNAGERAEGNAPLDLGNARLRILAAALGPAYVRVSGTWANSVYFHFAHSLRGIEGGVALVAVNADRATSRTLEVAVPVERYTLTAAGLQDTVVQLNGTDLQLGPDDSLPLLAGVALQPGPRVLTPLSITFLALPTASNDACR